MKSKGLVRFFAIVLTLVCLFQLSFTFVTNRIESKAKDFAQGDPAKEKAYIDSIARKPVFNILVKEYTYLECKERELNLGLDLQGGMNVTLEVSIGELVSALANNPSDTVFNEAIRLANERSINSQVSYVDLFAKAFKEVAPDIKLSTFFTNKENQNKVSFSSTDEEVIAFLKDEADQAIDRSFQILRARIDKFGVTQPNIQKLEGSGRILVELPGVDNPERVRKLLQGTAKLEFWETYNNADAYQYLASANDIIRKAQALENSDSTSTDTTQQEEAPQLTGLEDMNGDAELSALEDEDSSATAEADVNVDAEDTLEDSVGTEEDSSLVDNLSGDSTANDSTQSLTLEEFNRQNPLFAVLRPSANEQGQLFQGAVVGSSLLKDTGTVNRYLSMPAVQAVLPPNIRFLWSYKGFGPNEEVYTLYAIRTSKDNVAALAGDVITNANKDISPTGAVEVVMFMNVEGANAWRRLTKKNVDKSVAIVMDDVVYSAPNVTQEIPNGISSISGGLTNNEAEDLTNVLKSGKLPASTRIMEEAVVGPSLGQESIDKGLTSILVGFILVVLFMIFYYNRAGIVADIAVLANVFFIIGVLASLGAALTLPGIAGIVLTIGMAVDANVLINERVKEELLGNSRSLKNAIGDGYKNAFSSIIDANVTTLLAGFVLYTFGSGPVQGFAITLIIGILSSMFTAILLTRLITEWALIKGKTVNFFTNFSKGFLANLNYDFVSRRKVYYLISGVIIVAGVASLFTKGLSLGVDFKGGWSYVVQFEEDITSSEIKGALSGPLEGAPEVKTYGAGNKYKITTTYLINDQSKEASSIVEGKLTEGLSSLGGDAKILSSAKVGPTIASDIRRDAIWAIVIALIGIFGYILIRFRRWQYALGATVALTHDVLIMLGLYSIFDGILPFTMEIDQAFIAAVLTIIGFSINDTVVVFDRIREFLTTHRHETNTTSLINNALNKTFSRTIITSLTTFLVIFVLFLFGGEVIKGFAFALLIGIIFGTYSSIGIATPIVIDFDKKKK